MIQQIDWNEELAPLAAEFRAGWNARAAMAEVQQAQIAAANERLQRAHVEGLGQCTLSVHPDIYFGLEALHGKGCWADKDFRKRYLRDNPHLRVKSQSKNTTLRVNGLRA
jgi:hypothetical protein